MRTLTIATLALAGIMLSTATAHGQETVNICDRTEQVRDAILEAVSTDDCAAVDASELAGITSLDASEQGISTLKAGDFDDLINLRSLYLTHNQLTSLPDDIFDNLGNLQVLNLGVNQLTSLPDYIFDDLGSLQVLRLDHNPLTALPAGVFDGLASLQQLYLNNIQLASLPDGIFDNLANLEQLYLHNTPAYDREGNFNQLTTLPAGVFDRLGSLTHLYLESIQLTTLPDGIFDNLASLQELHLRHNQLTALPAGVFDGLASLQQLSLNDNQLTALPAGVFDNLGSLLFLQLQNNQLATLPDGIFDNLGGSLNSLDLSNNRLEGLSLDHPLFAMLWKRGITLEPQSTRLTRRIHLLLADSQTAFGRQGFVRIVNLSDEADTIRITATDDSGYSPDAVEIPMAVGQTISFNSGDLENGNPAKGIQTGIGAPVQGDWSLRVEAYSFFLASGYIRTTDGFLTSILRAGYWFAGHTKLGYQALPFNPASNVERQSRLRVINYTSMPANIQIDGRDDMGNAAGPVTFSLPGNQARILSAIDLEEGAMDLEGTLGDGAGKWHLTITAESEDADGQTFRLGSNSFVVVNLLYSSSGHVTSLTPGRN